MTVRELINELRTKDQDSTVYVTFDDASDQVMPFDVEPSKHVIIEGKQESVTLLTYFNEQIEIQETLGYVTGR